MGWHPRDDELIALLYEVESPHDLARTRAHLTGCDACRLQYDEWRESLALVSDADVPEPRPGFEARVWAAVARELPLRPPAWSARQLVPLLAFAAVLAMALGLGYQWASRPVLELPEVAPVDEVPSVGLQERVLLTALDQHFGQTETLLVELLNAPEATEGEFAYERSTADDLVSSGRLYRETAQQTGDRAFADVLDDLESVLVEVARSPDVVARNDVESWRMQIEDNGLLFKVRAITHEIRARQDDVTPANKGAL